MKFAEVNGSLKAVGRPWGFTILSTEGAPLPLIYRIDLEGQDAVLHVANKVPAGATVAYGWGKNPFVNLTDEAEMGMPAFSGLPVAP